MSKLPIAHPGDLSTPATVLKTEATQHTDIWRYSRLHEFGGMLHTGTFAPTYRPNGNAIDAKWVFDYKAGGQGWVLKEKLRAGVCMVITYSKGKDQVANPTRGQLNRVKWIFPCPHSRLGIWSRETGSTVPPRVSLLISILRLNLVLTYLRDSSRVPRRRPFIFVNRYTPSGQSRFYRVTKLRTDGVHCR